MFKTTSPSSQGPRHQGGARASHRRAKERWWGGGGMDKILVFLSYSFCYTFKVSEQHMTFTVMRGPLRAN